MTSCSIQNNKKANNQSSIQQFKTKPVNSIQKKINKNETQKTIKTNSTPTTKKDNKPVFSIGQYNEHIYGSTCGITGEDPYLRIKIEMLIKKKLIKEIYKMLWSADRVKQVYATEALIRLSNNNNIKLSRQKRSRISKVKNSEKTIKYCNGCEYEIGTIKHLLKPFELKQ